MGFAPTAERFPGVEPYMDRVRRYAIALAAVTLATVIRLAFDPWVGDRYVFTLQFGAIAVTGWAAGVGPAVLAAVLAYLATDYFFIEPRGALSIDGIDDAFGLATYLVSSGLLVFIGEALSRARAASNRARDSLNLALEAANMNTFNVDLDGRTAERSSNARRFYGLDDKDEGRDAFLRHMHPEDRQKHLDAIHQSRTTGKEYLCQYRFTRPTDGRLMWVEAHGKVIHDAAGKAWFAGTSLDVTERVLLEQKLREQSQRLALESRRKSEFIATLAHELRNPLAPIKTSIHLIKGSQAEAHTRQMAIEVLERQTARIERLVEDLLDVSRIEQGKIVLHRDKVDLGSLINKAAEVSMPHLNAKSQRLSVQVPREPVLVNVDEGRMIQVVTNLLNNSAKFTQENGSISIVGGQEGGQGFISVKDNGIGIPPEDLKAIFEVFFQLGPAANHPNAGLGLGLTLCKSLVEMHGGRMEVRSEGPGKGSEFIVRLPLSAS